MSDNPSGMVRPEPQHPIPTVGRVVLFTPDEDGQKITARKGFQAFPALITHVWTPSCVNLHVQNDGSFPLPTESLMPTSVDFADKPGETPRTWSWPPRLAAPADEVVKYRTQNGLLAAELERADLEIDRLKQQSKS